MATKKEFLELLRKGIDLEERKVFQHITESLKLVDTLGLPPEKKSGITKRLRVMRTETMSHNETLKGAMEEVLRGDASEY